MWQDPRFRITWEKAHFIFLSSLLVLGNVNFLMLADQHGDASTVIPIANMSFVIALLVPVALKMENLAEKKWVQWHVRSAQLFYLPKHNILLECQNTI